MIICPTPFLARGPVYRGPVRYIAMARGYISANNPVVTDLDYRVSQNGLKWYKKPLKGDINAHLRSDQSGAFFPEGSIVAFSALWVYGRIWDDGDNSRAVVFKLSGGEFNRVVTPIDGGKGATGIRYFSAAAVEAGNLVLICNNGERAISTDGASFTGYSAIAFTGKANAIAVGTGVVAVGGDAGQLFTGASASGAFTSRTSQFGTTPITQLVAGNVLLAAGGGKLSTAPLNNGTAWTARTDPVGGSNDWAAYGNARWLISGIDKLITSVDAATWANVTARPNVGKRLSAGFWDTDHWLVCMLTGELGISADGLNWEVLTNAGLPAKNYRIFAKLP